MQQFSPELITFNAAIGSCKRSGQWEIALWWFQDLSAAGKTGLSDVFFFIMLDAQL